MAEDGVAEYGGAKDGKWQRMEYQRKAKQWVVTKDGGGGRRRVWRTSR